MTNRYLMNQEVDYRTHERVVRFYEPSGAYMRIHAAWTDGETAGYRRWVKRSDARRGIVSVSVGLNWVPAATATAHCSWSDTWDTETGFRLAAARLCEALEKMFPKGTNALLLGKPEDFWSEFVRVHTIQAFAYLFGQDVRETFAEVEAEPGGGVTTYLPLPMGGVLYLGTFGKDKEIYVADKRGTPSAYFRETKDAFDNPSPAGIFPRAPQYFTTVGEAVDALRRVYGPGLRIETREDFRP